MKLGALLVCSLLALSGLQAQASSVRLKDIGRFQDTRENQLIGYGLVTGLAGTGDSARNRVTRQSLANSLTKFNINIPSEQIQSRNVAAVMITANLPPAAVPGSRIDVTVTSIGDARSLAGGSLLMTPLQGPDGNVYALAQGGITLGGYRFEANDNLVQKNHPTTGLISGGAVIEATVPMAASSQRREMAFVLNRPDLTTASRIADAINRIFPSRPAQVRDAGHVAIKIGVVDSAELTRQMVQIEQLTVSPDTQARIVINERTGTVVAGGDVMIAPITLAHGGIKVAIETEPVISQPLVVGRAGTGVNTVVAPYTRIASEERDTAYLTLKGQQNSVADLVTALGKLKIGTRDIIAILQGIQAAGALHAELVIQ
ncbi:MAG: flagellar basal body P-ring protein FlgI [Burkholderiales bacterium]|nr:flagellar basal body P-ring protein FlgI [Burkholderiales bacterium]